jgi:hypothetical protein
MRRIECVLLAGMMTMSGVAFAQAAMPLPKSMSGRWTAVIPGGRVFTDSLSVVLEAPDASGAVTGRLNIRGVACGAQDEPLAGTWDGTELRFESKVRPNINVTRPSGDCGSGRIDFVLVRKPGQSSFEGESRRDGAATPTQITLAP